MNCRHCRAALTNCFLDLGFAPPSNAYLTIADLDRPEAYYPLRIKVCDRCWLVQTEDYVATEQMFSGDYAYFSSTSQGWLVHAARYAAHMRGLLSLSGQSLVVEVASNDGYLLKNFVSAGIPCLGVEPTASTAAAAERLGIPVLREFFTASLAAALAADGQQADLIVGNNVYAHVPDINDFTRGLKTLLKSDGVLTLEFPHLLRLLEETQFDTVYHEHFSYLSLYTAQRIFAAAGLRIWDVEELATHGGSLRIYGCHEEDARETKAAVGALLQREAQRGLQSIELYRGFQARVDQVKYDLLEFLIGKKRAGQTVAGYGAAAKGNTLLNYAGIRADLLPFVCDAAPFKQGRRLPGSHIPILAPQALGEYRPDYVLVLPWNIADEIIRQQCVVRSWGGQFVKSIPHLTVL